jgi:hypothetical protein
MLDDLNYNVVLNVIEYLNVLDSGRLAATSKRYLYLVCEYRRLRGPEIAVSSSWDASNLRDRSAMEVALAPIERLQMPPNLVLAFESPDDDIALQGCLSYVLPSNAVVLGACATDIQVNIGRKVQVSVESMSVASVMFASFPNAVIRTFMFDGNIVPEGFQYSGSDMRKMAIQFKEFANELLLTKHHWKSIIVYAAGQSADFVGRFLSVMQSHIPHIDIVGGMCDSGYVTILPSRNDLNTTKTVRQLRLLIRSLGGRESEIDAAGEKSDLVDLALRLQNQRECGNVETINDGIFGIVLGGDVPVKSIVTRGVRRFTHEAPQPSSPYVVKTSGLYTSNGFEWNHHIQDCIHKETGRTISVIELFTQARNNNADYFGVRRPHDDGFELYDIDEEFTLEQEALSVPSNWTPDREKGYDKSSEDNLAGAEVDFFCLDGEACCQDVDRTLSLLRNQTQGDEILGAIMFSCSGRGPRQCELIREDMMDATRFARAFPDVPCLGFYADGEIGPMALVGNRNVFRKGRAAVQGYTAVFCLFIVPVVKRRDYELDDSPDAVHAFIKERLTRN